MEYRQPNVINEKLYNKEMIRAYLVTLKLASNEFFEQNEKLNVTKK
jgi:hypothetical protein